MDVYRDIIIDATKHPQNYGKLEGADVVSHHLNPSCGDEITVYLKLSDDKKNIADIRWEGEGCAISRAAMSLLSDELKGTSINQIRNIDKKYMEKLLGLEEIAVGREKCLMIGFVSIKKALES